MLKHHPQSTPTFLNTQAFSLINNPPCSVYLFNHRSWTGDFTEYNVHDTQCRNLDMKIKHNILSADLDKRTLRGCMFYLEEDCLGDNFYFLPAESYARVPKGPGAAASFRCYPIEEESFLASEGFHSQDVIYPAMDNSVLQAANRPNGQPNGTVTLYTYPYFKGQYTKFRVFSKHCYLPPRKLRNSVKSLIISDKIDSCTFWSEPGCTGDPYWLGAGKIEDLKNEGSSFVSFQCLLVGEEDPEDDYEVEELKKREDGGGKRQDVEFFSKPSYDPTGLSTSIRPYPGQCIFLEPIYSRLDGQLFRSIIIDPFFHSCKFYTTTVCQLPPGMMPYEVVGSVVYFPPLEGPFESMVCG
ncbi:hypothetical protein DL98DRAFT_587913 [Cadophora sp. DSE1049]|nr:hypothetical protein DL98DRAFT_587913 [Cadophora sp. DSE1049]